MTQEEYSAACAKNNAEYKKKSLRLQRALQACKDQIHDFTKNYLEKIIEKAIQQIKVDMVEAAARTADIKARLNHEYVASLKEGGYTGDWGPGPEKA